MKIRYVKFSLAAAVVAALSLNALTSQAALIYDEDFEGASVGDNAGSLTPAWTGGAASSHSVQDAGDPFGASNQYLRMNGFGNPWTFGNGPAQTPSTIATMSFDFYADTTAASDGFLRAGLSRSGDAIFYDILPSTVGNDAVVHFDIVGNVSGSAVNYNGGSLADGQFDVWIDGVKDVDGGNLLSSGNFDGFYIWVNNGGTVDAPVDAFFIDNAQYRDEAFVFDPVPEPASIALFGLGMVGLLVGRRRV
ncbi:PEP-CTERM sorting domain-containing protein [Adhaeretor mobilis]|uniref:PEP-CTERM motif protein n=1 Tax=Adhaeretor mobilis TaxID=1930276 RepID=A0A517MUB9_9BACT|nr:PEP-CTERM sorting domain-containing protein [Adhaeretor mobilis]QDS98481.1 PEP-CTERM motif protein [Adhaeretor mobilis]